VPVRCCPSFSFTFAGYGPPQPSPLSRSPLERLSLLIRSRFRRFKASRRLVAAVRFGRRVDELPDKRKSFLILIPTPGKKKAPYVRWHKKAHSNASRKFESWVIPALRELTKGTHTMPGRGNTATNFGSRFPNLRWQTRAPTRDRQRKLKREVNDVLYSRQIIGVPKSGQREEIKAGRMSNDRGKIFVEGRLNKFQQGKLWALVKNNGVGAWVFRS